MKIKANKTPRSGFGLAKFVIDLATGEGTEKSKTPMKKGKKVSNKRKKK